MSEYYIRTPSNVIYSLDATTSMTYISSGNPTSFPVESGASLSDHYVNSNVRASISGIITDVKSLSTSKGSSKSTEDFIRELTTLKESGNPFTVIIGSKLQEIRNCVFTSLSVFQRGTQGSRRYADGKTVASYEIEMSFEQIRIARGAKATTTNFVAPDQTDEFVAKKKTGEATKEVDEGIDWSRLLYRVPREWR